MEVVFWKSSSGVELVKEEILSPRLSEKDRDKIMRQIFLLETQGHSQFAKQGDFKKIHSIGIWELKIDYHKFHYRVLCGIEKYILF
jgi:hypothetical protein